MPSPSNRPDRVVLAMAPGRNRSLLADWLGSQPSYEVVTTDPEGSLPETYDVCLLDVASFRTFREKLTGRLEAPDAVYLPHVLLIRPNETTGRTQDRLQDFGSIADELVDEDAFSEAEEGGPESETWGLSVHGGTLPFDTIDFTETGATGYPTEATVEAGEKLFVAANEELDNHLDWVIEQDLAELWPKPHK